MIFKLLLLLLAAFGSLYAIEPQYNFLKNPGFEQGKRDWDADGNTKLKISTDAHSGQKAISYKNGGLAQSTDELSGIDGQTRYILSGYYKNRGSVDGMWMGIEFADANWNSLGSSEIALLNSYQYAPFAIVATPPAGTVYITYWTWSESPAGGDTLLDDLALYRENATPGNHAPILDAVADQQNVIGENVNLQLHAADSDNDTIFYTVENLDETSTIFFDTKTGKFFGTASPIGNQVLKVYALDNRGGIAARAFNWNITAAPVTPCNILQNPGFEQNLFGWDIYASETERVTDAKVGNYALRIKAGGLDQFSQKITSAADTYEFNGYYKIEGAVDGAWAGLIFYDETKHAIGSQTVSLDPTSTYKKFVINATSTDAMRYVQAWIWTEGSGKVFLDELKISTSSCYNYVIPSSLPPGGIPVNKAPQFVVIGFDDNTKSEGIDWAIDLFKNRKNHDGSNARVSFYMNTKGLHEWIEDEPTKLAAAMQRLRDSGHEIGNHTFCHHQDIDSSNWDAFIQTVLGLNQSQWEKKISDATNDLVNTIGVSKAKIYGFRAPYLLYNQAMFDAVKALGLTYDCSIEEGYADDFDGTNFRWPYQLNQGSPGHNESWFGNPDNPNSVTISSIPELWELPNHVFMIPKDSECAAYGIKKGLWKRLQNKMPYLSGHKITGFDYNLWSDAQLNKAEVLGIFKYNLDLRLKGNRAPLMIGAHTQYYTQEWADHNAPNATYQEMRAAIREFVDYALSKPEVRIRPAIDIINWCANPVALQ
jgi:peptidoglycan/xylan/chitin deacetylase (PgdA/CDA1 family)